MFPLFFHNKDFVWLSHDTLSAGMITAAAYKKWEKAAIAGVSLVADAAEHLERAATVKEVEHDQDIPGSHPVAVLPVCCSYQDLNSGYL